MRWLCVLAVLGACAAKHSPPAPTGVSLVLDIPNGPLDPAGYSTVEVVLHEPTGDVSRTANVGADGSFDLGDIDPSQAASVEATLRSDTGAAVGYGRTATAGAIAGGDKITVPIRRPIAYIAGTVSRGMANNPNQLNWTEAPATFSDLATGSSFNGSTLIGATQAVMVIAAGPTLFMVTQATSNPNGALTGPAQILPVSTADHSVGTALSGSMTGAVVDGAGSDDGSTLVIGTTTQLFAVNTASGAVTPLAMGSFARVAMLTSDSGEIDAVAIKNRGATTGTCATTAELWWVTLSGASPSAHMVTTGGFSDVATDRGHAYYVDQCSGALGEATSTAVNVLRQITDGSATQGRPTALAMSNNQAYVGIEIAPATTSLVVAGLAAAVAPRTLWNEVAGQVMETSDVPGLQRQLAATAVTFDQLEVGAGGDYVALTTSGHFTGAEVDQAGVPMMTIDSDELRVFDAATGGVVQRYRSWCDGVLFGAFAPNGPDFPDWQCASVAGQSEAATASLEHRIGSMTFLFGKK